MKKLLLIAIMASGLVACAPSPAPKEDSKLKDAYSACINTAEGNPDKIEALSERTQRPEGRETASAVCDAGERQSAGLSGLYSGDAHR